MHVVCLALSHVREEVRGIRWIVFLVDIQSVRETHHSGALAGVAVNPLSQQLDPFFITRSQLPIVNNVPA